MMGKTVNKRDKMAIMSKGSPAVDNAIGVHGAIRSKRIINGAPTLKQAGVDPFKTNPSKGENDVKTTGGIKR